MKACLLSLLLYTLVVEARNATLEQDFKVCRATKRRFRPGEVLVGGSPLDVPPNVKVKKYLRRSNVTVIEVTPGHESEFVKTLRDDGMEAEENLYVYASMIPNDEYFEPYQWHLTRVQAREAWDVTTGEGVVVAVLDTGLADDRKLSNEKKYEYDGISCVTKPYNTVTENKWVYDKDGHGTHIAGTINQRTNNEKGAAGLAHGACIIPVKVLDNSGEGNFADTAEGIRYAVDNGAKVINLSLGTDANVNMRRDYGIVDRALDYAYKKGVTVVAAAGNEAVSTQIGYPSIYPSVIGIGAVDYNNERASYSNYGDGIDFVAPGGDTLQDANDDGFGDGILQEQIVLGNVKLEILQGRSMAAAHVAAAAALLISSGVATTPDEIKNALKRSAKDLGKSGYDPSYGHGLVQVYDGLTSAAPQSTASNKNVVACWKLHRKGNACRQRSDCRWQKWRHKCKSNKRG